mmetsp:Transcript_444/g.985  ORF Transcript_444/g.985 Transcript_444/m.985 type:complete len:94 (+) Transcript_444:100-381(+)
MCEKQRGKPPLYSETAWAHDEKLHHNKSSSLISIDFVRLPPSLGGIVQHLVPSLEGIQGVIMAGHEQIISIEIGSPHYSSVQPEAYGTNRVST